jgi:hypothetical protein
MPLIILLICRIYGNVNRTLPKTIGFASLIRGGRPRTFLIVKGIRAYFGCIPAELGPPRKYDLRSLENILANPYEALDRFDQLLTVVSYAVFENDLDIFDIENVL